MQDRLKFRTWNPDINSFVYWGWIKKGEYKNMCSCREISKDELLEKYTQQCTGLKDKNGKLIYEGDILEGYKIVASSPINAKYELKRGLVKIPSGMFVATCQDLKENCTLFVQFDWNKNEIIGNIYENPELLEGNING